jgi:hypothetical protein
MWRRVRLEVGRRLLRLDTDMGAPPALDLVLLKQNPSP